MPPPRSLSHIHNPGHVQAHTGTTAVPETVVEVPATPEDAPTVTAVGGTHTGEVQFGVTPVHTTCALASGAHTHVATAELEATQTVAVAQSRGLSVGSQEADVQEAPGLGVFVPVEEATQTPVSHTAAPQRPGADAVAHGA